MKKLILAAAVAVCLISSVCSVLFAAETAQKLNRSSAATGTEIKEIKKEITALGDTPECFAVLRETDGIIGLYDSDGKVLICTIDTPVISLPEKQRSEIMVGMRVKSSLHFMQLFENLTE